MVRNDFVYAPQLDREVVLDIYQYSDLPRVLLLVNDGQELRKMQISSLLDNIQLPVVIVGIHAGPRRLQEYGVAGHPDFQGNGAEADRYAAFITNTLLPLYPQWKHLRLGIAGFSLGGLSALDIVWRHADLFSFAGVCSGSLWWRDVPLGPGYSDEQHRIIHRIIAEDEFKPGLQFFFECGTEDETADRNGNGVIDAIDDTQDLIKILASKGYSDITYYEIPGGRHDMATWEVALQRMLRLPYFAGG
ncbi:Enterochelin esterase [Chitinophaga jiangningensis]|uniref:Enterochelin esterase n=1 Tax=Chitinophaga jiangningensis TaxID=1419482 RepID=A0A1M7CCE2_9BACT|nr:alpha/beta hydrolase-fold protein [Chitinophaga jiangningensis]SHL64891.1 Enterochelin esterase [Chitinophaga jiangningensis]